MRMPNSVRNHCPYWVPCLLGMMALTFVPGAQSAGSEARAEQAIRSAMHMDQNIQRGQRIYLKNCAECHGAQALGNATGLIPALAGQRKSYLIKQMADFTELERDSRDMQQIMAHTAVWEPQVWADMAGYLSGLEPLSSPETGNGVGLKSGEALFKGRCASCHHADARGDDEGFVPSLRNQHYSYLLTQMRKLGAGHRSHVDDDLIEFFDSLDPEEMTAAADYLSRLRGATRDQTRMNPDGTLDR